MFSFSKTFVSTLAVLSMASGSRAAGGRSVARRSRPVPRQDAAGEYKLAHAYEGDNFFSGFNFFSGNDPTHGQVKYLDRDAAMSKGLAYVDRNVVVIAADDKTALPLGAERDSVRISSIATFDQGLIIADIAAMPYGCSVWPALWTVGPNWPKGGEIDILENVNNNPTNQNTLHTDEGCKIDPVVKADVTGKLSDKLDCASSGKDNSGCAIHYEDNRSYGKGFNEAGGGVYATLVDSQGVRIWFFSRADGIPTDIQQGKPDPTKWGKPVSFFKSTTCKPEEFIHEHSIIFNITFCGDWAGSAYPNSGCPGTCAQAVRDPNNFKDAKWRINYVRVYQPS